MCALVFGGLQLSKATYLDSELTTSRAATVEVQGKLSACTTAKDSLKVSLDRQRVAVDQLEADSRTRNAQARKALQQANADALKAERKVAELLAVRANSTDFCDIAKEADQLMLDSYK